MATAETAQLSQSLAALRRAVADRFGDLTQLTTTASGSSTTLIDALNVNAGSEHFNGRQLLVTSGNYSGHKARVTATADSTGTLTFTPAAGGTIASGVTVDVFNRRGVGFTIPEYTRAINNAIDDAFPLGLVETTTTLSAGAISADAYQTVLTVPADLYEVYAVEWQDDDGLWREVPKASRSNGHGWRANPDGTLVITGLPQDDTEESSIRLRGYQRQATLSAETDTCLLPKEWLVARAAYHLALGAVMRGSEYGAMAQQFGRESEMLRTRLRTVRKANSERVRSA